MKILIVAHFFPPENGGAVMASQRPYSWAKYWSQMGHEIVVLTTAKEAYCHQPLTENFQIKGVKYWPARPPSATTEAALSPPTQLQAIEQGIYQLLRQALLGIYKNLGSGTLLFVSNTWTFPAVRQALKLYQDWPYDIVVSTYGPPCSHLVGGILKRELPVFWVADYRDLWHGYDFLITKWPFSYFEKQLENFLLAKTDLVTTVSEGFSEQLARRFQKITLTIPNGFDVEELPTPSSKPSSSKLTMVHTGNIYPRKRDPDLLFQALHQLLQEEESLLKNLELHFYGWDSANLLDLIERYDLDPWVKYLGYVDREQTLNIQQQADILLYLDWQDPLVDGVIGGKLYEYMFAGRPILAIGATPTTAAGKIITECEIGLCAGTTIKSVQEALKFILVNPPSFYSLYSADHQKIEKFSRKSLAQNMLKKIIKYKNGSPDQKRNASA